MRRLWLDGILQKEVPLSCETVEREASQKNVLSEDSIKPQPYGIIQARLSGWHNVCCILFTSRLRAAIVSSIIVIGHGTAHAVHTRKSERAHPTAYGKNFFGGAEHNLPSWNLLVADTQDDSFMTSSFHRHTVKARAFKIVQIFSVNRDQNLKNSKPWSER